MGDPANVERFYARHQEVYRYLVGLQEVTFASDLNDTFNRSLVLAIASHFEHEVTQILREVPKKHAGSNPFISSMIERQVIARKYHTYFDWDRLSANTFFALFGDAYKSEVLAKLKEDVELKKAVNDFLELGQVRNKLVHQDFVAYTIDRTPEELIEQFRSALRFVEYLWTTLIPYDTENAGSRAV